MKKIVFVLSLVFSSLFLGNNAYAVLRFGDHSFETHWEIGKKFTGVAQFKGKKSCGTVTLIDTEDEDLRGRVVLTAAHILIKEELEDMKISFVSSDSESFFDTTVECFFIPEDDRDIGIALLAEKVDTNVFKPLTMNFNLEQNNPLNKEVYVVGCSPLFQNTDYDIIIRSDGTTPTRRGIIIIPHCINHEKSLVASYYVDDSFSAEENSKDLEPLRENISEVDPENNLKNSGGVKDYIRSFKQPPDPESSGFCNAGDSGGPWIEQESGIFAVDISTIFIRGDRIEPQIIRRPSQRFLPIHIWLKSYQSHLKTLRNNEKKPLYQCGVAINKGLLLCESQEWIMETLSLISSKLKEEPSQIISSKLKEEPSQSQDDESKSSTQLSMMFATFSGEEDFSDLFLGVKDLNLTCSNIKDEWVSFLPDTIEHLNLSKCHNLTGDCFKNLPANLKTLNLYDNNFVNDESLMKIPSTLKMINLSLCQFITQEGIASLQARLPELAIVRS